eukprot:1273673-Prymnesium_polylepis.2
MQAAAASRAGARARSSSRGDLSPRRVALPIFTKAKPVAKHLLSPSRHVLVCVASDRSAVD